MADVVREQGEAELVGFLDDDNALLGRSIDGTAVLGSGQDQRLLADHAVSHFVAAIGNNRVRAEVADRLVALGLKPWSAVHPATTISEHAVIGDGAQIVAGVIVNAGAQIGRHAVLNTACSVDHDCRIGHYAFVGPGARLGGAVEVGEGAFIGMGATVVQCLCVGARATVGAGAVVIRNVPADTVVVGCPACPIHTGT
jgi:sugar O-acyltransferase (sialic acid O-acetyltransferase NeuD family)